jgi:hypothetical protein
MLKKLAIVIMLVLIACGRFGKNAVEERYKQFAEEMLQRRYDAAAAMTDGLTAAELGELGTQERIGAGPAMFQTLFPSRFVIDTREKAADGAVILHATQTVLFNPAGVESIRPAMFATMKQVVTLKQRDGAWRVTAFTNSFEKMDSLSVH